MRRKVKLLNHGWILPTKSLGWTGTGGLAINGTAPVILSPSYYPLLDGPLHAVPVTRNSGNGRYARAYLDFFEDEVVRSNYDWKRVVLRYVVEGDEPLLSGLISGGMEPLSVFVPFRFGGGMNRLRVIVACHPLIHLAYAYELNNVEVATEGPPPPPTIAPSSHPKTHR